MRLTDARKGETIRFWYTRGDNGPSYRLLTVEEVDKGDGRVGGFDLERQGYRNFLDQHATNVDVLVQVGERIIWPDQLFDIVRDWEDGVDSLSTVVRWEPRLQAYVMKDKTNKPDVNVVIQVHNGGTTANMSFVSKDGSDTSIGCVRSNPGDDSSPEFVAHLTKEDVLRLADDIEGLVAETECLPLTKSLFN